MKEKDVLEMINLIKEDREKFVTVLKEIFEENKIAKDLKIKLNNELLTQLFLKKIYPEEYYEFRKDDNLMLLYKYIDFIDFSYDKLFIKSQKDLDLMAEYKIPLYTSAIFEKDLRSKKLKDVYVIGNFDDFKVSGTDFTGIKGSSALNPKKVFEKNISRATICDVYVNSDLDDCCIENTNFKGYKGKIILHPQKTKNMKGAILDGVYIDGNLDGCDITHTNFKGYKGKVTLNPQNIKKKEIIGTKLSNVVIMGSFDGCYIYSVDFQGSVGAQIDLKKLNIDSDWGLKCNFKDASIYNWEDGEIINNYYCYQRGYEYEFSNFDGARFVYNTLTKKYVKEFINEPQFKNVSFVNINKSFEKNIRDILTPEIRNQKVRKLKK